MVHFKIYLLLHKPCIRPSFFCAHTLAAEDVRNLPQKNGAHLKGNLLLLLPPGPRFGWELSNLWVLYKITLILYFYGGDIKCRRLETKRGIGGQKICAIVYEWPLTLLFSRQIFFYKSWWPFFMQDQLVFLWEYYPKVLIHYCSSDKFHLSYMVTIWKIQKFEYLIII